MEYMRKIFLLVFVLVSFSAFSQVVQFPTNYGVGYRRTGGDTLSWIPNDTSSVTNQLINRRHIAIKGGTLYYWNGSAWASLSSGGGSDTATLAAYFLRRKDSATGTNLDGYLTRTSVNDYVSYPYFGVTDNSGQDRSWTTDGGSFRWIGMPTYTDTSLVYPLGLTKTGDTMVRMNGWPVGSGGGSGMAIAGLITSATKGSVLYAGTSGRLQQSNSRFYYDSATSKLGIAADGQTPFSGSYLPKAPLHIIESQTGQPRGLTIDNYNAASNAGSVLLRKGRGTFASPTAVQAGDAIGSIAMDGYPFNTHTAVFSAIATENYSTGHGGSMFRFELSDTGQVSPSPIVYMTGIGGGKMSILNNNPSATLDVTGYIYQTPGSFAGTTKYLHTNGSNAASTTNLNPGVLIYSGAGSDWGLDLGYNSGTSRYRSRLFSNTGGDVALSYSTGGPTAQSNFVDVLVVKGSTNFVGIANPDPAELLSLGTSGTTQGNIGIYGSTSGKAIITTAAAAGTPTITLPTATGTLATLAGTETFTNKRWTARVGSTTSSATPTINTDNYDIYKLTAQTADITSFTTNLSGTPNDGDILEIQITGTAARAITWGSSFVASTVALPTTTVTTATLTTIFQYYTTSSYGNNKWVCVNSY